MRGQVWGKSVRWWGRQWRQRQEAHRSPSDEGAPVECQPEHRLRPASVPLRQRVQRHQRHAAERDGHGLRRQGKRHTETHAELRSQEPERLRHSKGARRERSATRALHLHSMQAQNMRHRFAWRSYVAQACMKMNMHAHADAGAAHEDLPINVTIPEVIDRAASAAHGKSAHAE